MKFIRIFKVPKHSRYSYIPRFYDPDKEALQERLKSIELQKQNNTEAMKMRIASGLKSGYGDRAFRKKSILKSNLIIIGLVAILCLLAILFINYYLPRILESL